MGDSHRAFLAATEANADCPRRWVGIATFHARHPEGNAQKGQLALREAGSISHDGTLEAELLLRLGRFDDALAVVERVIALTHNPYSLDVAKELRQRILAEES